MGEFNFNGISISATRLKLDHVLDLADVRGAQIIALQESNQKDSISLKIQGYNTYRSDKKDKRGGGLAFLIRDLTYQSIDIDCAKDSDLENQDKIITGSHSGVLRIYKPQPVKQEDGTYSSFRAEDLLLETQLKHPIINLGVGALSSTSSLLHLAVLQPFKLSVFAVSAVQGSVEHGTQFKLSLIYEHNLQRHAFSLIIGYFGGIHGKEMMCIQCLDGTLCFFEQERFSFSRFLPKSLIPGPMCYVPKTDSFVTVNVTFLVPEMSLFKACDWWTTSCGADEEFDKGCLVVANVDNSPEKCGKGRNNNI
ncbi:protein PTHB1 [Trichonephila inaurata madagascariensis]|uniref:Protein PTHB1 n=1 Tax=Trichonephila inaurata madagascariensis TaxID=2747483 RepID=A0A8X6YDG4_9ARAC|nr:protein PTHB1 [Trichonephila inaurata madagascariensis]